MGKIKESKYLVLSILLLLFVNIRLFWLPGATFNSQNWDDEIGWIKDSSIRSPLEYLFYRDAPGYFVLIPRVIILLGSLEPKVGSFETLRLLVLVTQLLCFGLAASCVVSWDTNWKMWVSIFSALSATYIEDLNYVHNLGYLFIFPIYFLLFRRILLGLRVRSYHLILSIALISKPFTALIVLCLASIFYFFNKRSRYSLVIVAMYSMMYLAAYIFLPHRWDTPFNLEVSTIGKIVFDLPWIVFSAIFPAVTIGFMGVLRVFNYHLLRDLFGIFTYIVLFSVVWKFRKKIALEVRNLTLFAKSLISIFVLNYVLVFSASDSFWVKYFPLFRLDSPQFIWARWSSVIPLVTLLIIASLATLSKRIKFYLLFFISIQWVLLTFLAQTWLRRYW